MGHPSLNVLSIAAHLTSMKITSLSAFNFCSSCQYGKNKKLPFQHSLHCATQPLEIIHTDIWGPAPIPSTDGYRYYIHFIDEFSRYTWIFPIKLKFEVSKVFLHFKTLVENLIGHSIKTLQSNWGGENRSLEPILQSLGINFCHSCPYIHEQNGSAERKHRHITEMGLCLLAHASLLLSFWWNAFTTAVYLINCLSTPALIPR